jgi:hypothetical protein
LLEGADVEVAAVQIVKMNDIGLLKLLNLEKSP